MKFVKSLFSEHSEVSMMRVLSLISLAVAAVLAFIGKDTSVSVFVIMAFGGKASQKYIETISASKDK